MHRPPESNSSFNVLVCNQARRDGRSGPCPSDLVHGDWLTREAPRKVTHWYQHRYHTISTHEIVFAIIPRVPRFVHPAIAAVTALIFYLLLAKERRAVIHNMRVITHSNRLVI